MNSNDAAIESVAAKTGCEQAALEAEPLEATGNQNMWKVTDTNTGEIYLYGVRSGHVLPGNTVQIKP
jgi:hypothetical protein